MKFRKFLFLYNINFIIIINQVYGNVPKHIIKKHNVKLKCLNLSDEDATIIENRDRNNKISSLHLWFGINAPDEIRHELVKTFAEILSEISKEDWPPKITREIQGHETMAFRKIINQKPVELEMKLYLVRGTEHVAATQILIRRVNINCNASYVLQSPEAIFVIHGSKASEEEKETAEMLGNYILNVDSSEYTLKSRKIKIGILTKTELLTRNETIREENIKKLKEELETLNTTIPIDTLDMIKIEDKKIKVQIDLQFAEREDEILKMNLKKYRTTVSEKQLPDEQVEENNKVLDEFYFHILRGESLINKEKRIYSEYSQISDEQFVNNRYQNVHVELKLAEAENSSYPINENMCDGMFNIYERIRNYYFDFSCNTGLIFKETVKQWEEQKLTFHVFNVCTAEETSFIYIGHSPSVSNIENTYILQSGEKIASGYRMAKLMFVQPPYPAAFLIHFKDYKEIISEFLLFYKRNPLGISFATTKKGTQN